jgi:hypothetical protein
VFRHSIENLQEVQRATVDVIANVGLKMLTNVSDT